MLAVPPPLRFFRILRANRGRAALVLALGVTVMLTASTLVAAVF